MRRLLSSAAAMAALLAGGAAFPCGGSFGENITVDPHQDHHHRLEEWRRNLCVPAHILRYGHRLWPDSAGAGLTVERTVDFDAQAFTAAIASIRADKLRSKSRPAGVGCGF